jgi:lipoprotein-releasing system permease protein
MLEGIMISAIAGLVGVVIGTIAAPVLSTALLPPITGINSNSVNVTSFVGRQVSLPGLSLSATAAIPSVDLLLLVFIGALLLGALGTLYPAWRASRTSPMEALRHE